MPDERITAILSSKTDMTKEEISTLTTNEAWAIIYSLRKAPDSRLEICFTGFLASQKQELEDLASAKNFKVVTAVTKHLAFLVGGENAGPAKLAKAAEQGVQVLTGTQFVSLAEHGLVPGRTDVSQMGI